MLQGKLRHGAAAMSARDALELATRGGATCLGRTGEIGQLSVGAARRQRAEEDLRRVAVVDAVHADAVAEQRSTAPAAGRVDREDGDAELVLLVEPEAAHELVGER